MTWRLSISPKAQKTMAKLDRYTRRMIVNWIDKHLNHCEDPRAFGKPLTGNWGECWRYRIGDYRLICKIEDEAITILLLKVGHRKEVYE